MTMVVVAVAHVSAVMFVIVVICASLHSDGSTSKGKERKKERSQPYTCFTIISNQVPINVS